MKIIFNPAFDSGYYVDLSKSRFSCIGTKIVGLSGLLEVLSLRNGLTGRYMSDGERMSAYLSCVQNCANGTFVANSFKTDKLGVTKQLLQWRDKLIMAGWKCNIYKQDETLKLQLLSEIEKEWKAKLKGDADRWSELASLSEKQQLIAENDEVQCTCAKEQLPLLVQKILVSCNATFQDYPENLDISKKNIKVIHYNDLNDVYRHIAYNTNYYADSLLINRDNVSLNHALLSCGSPLQDATIQDSNPLTLQLFKLAMSAFSRPINIKNIVSYLQLPLSPIPSRLSYKLANILISSGGFGDINLEKLNEDQINEYKSNDITNKWEQTIYDYIHQDTDKTEKKKREKKAGILKYITDNSIYENSNIKIDSLTQYITTITKWASNVINAKDEPIEDVVASQLFTVMSYFKQLTDSLQDMTEIPFEELEKRIRIIYQPISITQARAQVGALNIVTNYSQIIDSPKSLVWLDCCEADNQNDAYDFLSAKERSWLNAQDGVCVPSFSQILYLNRKEMISQISKIDGEIILITSDYHHNKKMTEHPLIAELKMLKGDSFKIEEGCTSIPRSEDEQEVKKIEPKLQYNLGKIDYNGRTESNTSIDTLINYPFDYVVNYIARLSDANNTDFQSMNLIKGNVAHHFIQNLVEDAKFEVDTMQSLLDVDFDSRIMKSIAIYGLELLLKENGVDFANFKYLLKRSVGTLITIMKNKGLKPVGCEQTFNEGIGEIENFTSRIDLILKDKDDNRIVFDFKWSYAKKYQEQIENGIAIQLELYRQELTKNKYNVVAVGFYLMPKCVLVTSDYDTLEVEGNTIIQHFDSPKDSCLFDQIQKSIEQRRNEISQGLIEEGEGMDIKDLPYITAIAEGKDLLTVGNFKIDKKSNTIKSSIKDSKMVYTNTPESRFEHNKREWDNDNTPLNEKPTTNPLLKGRLK